MGDRISSRVSNNPEFMKLKEETERGNFLYKVYGLVDPRDGKLFYVGCTRELIYFRVYNHFLESKNTKKKQMLTELLDKGLFPIVEVFYEMEEREHAYMIERYLTNFIYNYSDHAKLVNIRNTKKINTLISK